MESLCSGQLVRKELLPGQPPQARFSLLPKGDTLGQFCSKMQSKIQNVISSKQVNKVYDKIKLKLVVDTREDTTFAKRLMEQAQDVQVLCEPRELPAGDYLFLNEKDDVLPLIIERKSWPDLADSVSGSGTTQNRLDCVRLFSQAKYCPNGKCQLCRMKASGCSKVLFIIEGARCTCCISENRTCQYCKELKQRHQGVTQQILETEALSKLSTTHHCIILFTRGYNETIQSLLILHQLISTTAAIKKSSSLSYQNFCSNARKASSSTRTSLVRKGTFKRLSAESFVKGVHDDSADQLFISGNPTSSASQNLNEAIQQEAVETESSDSEQEDSQLSVLVLDDEPSSKKETNKNAIALVVLTGLVEYDQEYFQDINKLWQYLYHTNKENMAEFQSSLQQKLEVLQEQESPFVSRHSILFWLIKVQLLKNILIYPTRQAGLKDDLDSAEHFQRCWNLGGDGVAQTMRRTPSPSTRPSGTTTAISTTFVSRPLSSRATPTSTSRRGGVRDPPPANHENTDEVIILDADDGDNATTASATTRSTSIPSRRPPRPPATTASSRRRTTPSSTRRDNLKSPPVYPGNREEVTILDSNDGSDIATTTAATASPNPSSVRPFGRHRATPTSARCDNLKSPPTYPNIVEEVTILDSNDGNDVATTAAASHPSGEQSSRSRATLTSTRRDTLKKMPVNSEISNEVTILDDQVPSHRRASIVYGIDYDDEPLTKSDVRLLLENRIDHRHRQHALFCLLNYCLRQQMQFGKLVFAVSIVLLQPLSAKRLPVQVAARQSQLPTKNRRLKEALPEKHMQTSLLQNGVVNSVPFKMI